jgi:DNA (cytosine-5)-methyltransferase 1
MKVLNLYACLGGNRLLWEDCEVTAVELDPELARMYKERFPNDTVIVGDAHQYLLDHYKEFDFIWSSPPCPTHSRVAVNFQGEGPRKIKPKYPDMKLYQEIIFLKTFYKGKFVVENVIPYYTPLIPAQKVGRHLFWANFKIVNFEAYDADILRGKQKDNETHHRIDLSSYKGEQRRDKIAHNLVHFETGLNIFNQAKGIHKKSNTTQLTID